MQHTPQNVHKKDSKVSRKIGNIGEDKAAAYLASKGAELLCRNYYIRGAEIDIIFKEGDTTVFCEVKQRSGQSFGHPSESVNIAKQKRICKAALCWSAKNKSIDENYRFDIIEIIGSSINHIKSAFEFIEPK